MSTPSGWQLADRAPTYGDKVKRYEVFDHRHLFEHAPSQVYGTREDVSYLALNLL